MIEIENDHGKIISIAFYEKDRTFDFQHERTSMLSPFRELLGIPLIQSISLYIWDVLLWGWPHIYI